MAAIRRLARRYEGELLEKMVYMPVLDDVELQNVETVTAWFAELVERVTGKPLSHESLITHLQGKFGPLYGIS